MPTLKNPKHEQFAQALAKGKTQDEAYQIAGYKPSRSSASRLSTRGIDRMIRLKDIDPYETDDLDPKGVAEVAAQKMAALTKIISVCRFSPRDENEASARRAMVEPLIIFLLLAAMVSRSLPAWQRAACAAVIDILFYNWRDGAPAEALGYIVDRSSPEARSWRKSVLDRDGHKCAACGSVENLEAHHIVRWVDSPELRVDVANGVALCGDCHLATHGRRRH